MLIRQNCPDTVNNNLGRPSFATRPRALPLRASILGLTLAMSTVPAVAEPANEQVAEQQSYSIPAGPLGQSLNRFASEAGITLSYQPEVVAGKEAPALNGTYSPSQGLEVLLNDVGLTAMPVEDGGYRIQEVGQNADESVMQLEPIQVRGDALREGSAEAGYVVEGVTQLGPWGGRELVDTPYSVNVVSEELIENFQAHSTDQIFKLNPVTRMERPQSQNDMPIISMRGFQQLTVAHNGITREPWNYSHGVWTEEVERIEVLTGLSGFLYGRGNVGGLVNFVTKTPTENRLNSVTVGNTSGENLLLHGDFGGQFDADGTFGYRINVVTQDGETGIDNLDIDRDSLSAVFDWQPVDGLTVTAGYSMRDYESLGRGSFWSVDAGVSRPDADKLDPSKSYGQPWSSQAVESERMEVSVDWDINEFVGVRASYMKDEHERYYSIVDSTITGANTYSQTGRAFGTQRLEGEGGYFYGDFNFTTGSVQHALTAGVQMTESQWVYAPSNRTGNIPLFSNADLGSPTYVSEPNWPAYNTLPASESLAQRTRIISVGDDITISSQWSVLAGLSETEIVYNGDAQGSNDYDKSDITPTLSVIFKPQENISTYVSYIESLEQGGVARDTHGSRQVINAGEVMEPLISEQIEVGTKITLGETLLTAALFEIDRPLEYYQALNSTQSEYVQNGRQVHRGLEVTATGNLTPQLTLVGGITLLDAEIADNGQQPQLEGNTPANVSEEMVKAYLEYDLASVPGLTLNGGTTYVGDYYGDDANTDEIDGYALFDLGARYSMQVADKPLTLRLNVNNITDEAYWSNDEILGEGRTVSLSANVKF